MRPFAAVLALSALAACGGGGGRALSGDIAQACLAANRAAASPRLCACVQQAADQTLRPGDQARVVTFFEDPEEAHAMRIDDRPFAEAFWDRYRNFVDTSRALCG